MNLLPKVSLFVFCYQQADFIAQALTAALAQDYGNLQIIVSDDASTDDTYTIVQALTAEYQGPHQLTLNRNGQNLGIGRHFIHVMENLAHGELIVASAGDDICAPNRVSRIVQEWLASGKPAVVAHSLEEIDEHGQPFAGSRAVQYRLQNDPHLWPKAMALQDYLQHPFPLPFIGAALAYRRDIYQTFGTPQAEPAYEDHLMYFRALLSDGLHFFPEVLVKYRRHSNNFTAKPAQPQPKSLPVPALYADWLQNPTLFQPADVGIFRLHQLTTQQWLDYCNAIKAGTVAVEVGVATELWQQLHWRHRLLLKYQRPGAAALSSFRHGVSQIFTACCWQFGYKKYRYHDQLQGAGYAKPLRTVVFAAGSGGEKALANLGGAFEVVAVCDNNTKLHGGRFCGLPVISPKQLQDCIETIDCIVVASTYYHEIKATLTEQWALPATKISRAPFSCITRSFPSGVTAALSSAFIISTAMLTLLVLSALVALVLF